MKFYGVLYKDQDSDYGIVPITLKLHTSCIGVEKKEDIIPTFKDAILKRIEEIQKEGNNLVLSTMDEESIRKTHAVNHEEILIVEIPL